VLAGRERAHAAPTFEAAGLYLSRVEYEAQWQLPASSRSATAVMDLVEP
jgi:tRNA pseudouridine38-40 synthase